MGKIEHILPGDIERRSMEIIEAELGPTPWLSPAERLAVKRVIHTSADFDYRENLKFSPRAVEQGLRALRAGAVLVTDTQMGASGISKPALQALGCELHCFMADQDVAAQAKAEGSTRAAASMDKAARLFAGRQAIFAIGNAPTALIRLCQLAGQGALCPALVIGAPVGFVNVVQSKEMLMESECEYIAAAGRKGGSNVAAAICNALLYQIYDRETGRIKG